MSASPQRQPHPTPTNDREAKRNRGSLRNDPACQPEEWGQKEVRPLLHRQAPTFPEEALQGFNGVLGEGGKAPPWQRGVVGDPTAGHRYVAEDQHGVVGRQGAQPPTAPKIRHPLRLVHGPQPHGPHQKSTQSEEQVDAIGGARKDVGQRGVLGPQHHAMAEHHQRDGDHPHGIKPKHPCACPHGTNLRWGVVLVPRKKAPRRTPFSWLGARLNQPLHISQSGPFSMLQACTCCS